MRLKIGGRIFAWCFGAILTAGFGSQAIAGKFTTLYSFCVGGGSCTDGSFPAAHPIADAAGNLYGGTSSGGNEQAGVIYEMVRSGKTYSYQTLYTLNTCSLPCGQPDGVALLTPLILDTKGNLYGVTNSGGAGSGGTAFELSPDASRTTWTYQVLYNFCSLGGSACTDGKTPSSGLTYSGAANGSLYDGKSPLFGATLEGGTRVDGGVVYELTRAGQARSEQVLYSFCVNAFCPDGGVPQGDLAIDPASGAIYGTAGSGKNEDGVIFKVVNKREFVLHNFCKDARCKDGNGPQGVNLNSGILYGTTLNGGSKNNRGVVFEMAIGGSGESVLYTFCSGSKHCADGRPNGSLAFDGTNLFGAALNGGSDGGVLFELSGLGTESIIHHFCGPICLAAPIPSGGVVISGNNLFGVTQNGGTVNMGSIYENALP